MDRPAGCGRSAGRPEEAAIDGEIVRITNLRPAELTPATEEWLVDGLIRALPGLKMRELFAVRRDMFADADLITVAATADGDVAGVLSSRWATLDTGARFLHVTTQFVGERYRHGVVFRRSWAQHLTTVSAGRSGFPAINVLKTYNPRVYCAMHSLTAVPGVGFYPALESSTSDPDAARLAGRISRRIAPGRPFDPATGVIRGAGVPADLYSELPRSSNPAVNGYFARHARPGDRILCVLLVGTPQAADGVLRVFTAPRERVRR